MKFLKYNLYIVILLVSILSIFSCTGSDEYLKFAKNGEISYTGKVDSLKIFPGHNRVKLVGLIISDPKVAELRVYWNNKKDSVVLPITRTTGIDAVSTFVEGLAENIYNFQVKTFDAEGNGSISQNVTAQVFGERYQASLTDRKIIASKLSSDLKLTIDFAAMDLTTGAYATEVVYTDNLNVEHTITVPVTTNQIIVPNYKMGSQFKQRSLFLPVKTAVDIFYTPFVSKEPQVIDLTYLIKNNKRPFVASSFSGRWGILADWTTNAACKNHGGYGGVDFGCCGNLPATLNLESGWGSPAITNGKVYQTLTLEAGTYVFKANLYPAKNGSSGFESNYSDSDYVYITATAGTTLSDTNSGALLTNPATLGYKKIVNSTAPDSAEFTFTITQSQQVSLGFATTQFGDKFGHILGFNFYKKN